MTKSDVFLIISQIYCVGALATTKENKGFMNGMCVIFMVLSIIAWVGVK